MSNLLETARQLNNLKADFDMFLKIGFPEPMAINKLLKKLHAAEEARNDEKLLGSHDLEVLKDKVKSAYHTGKLNTIDRKVKKKFPFLLSWASKNSNALCRLLLEEIKQIDSMQLLRREIYIYFNEYGSGGYIKELKDDILKKLKKYDKNNSFLLSMKSNTYFFNPMGIGYVRERCAASGIFPLFNALHFPKLLLHSTYVKDVIEGIFKASFTKLNLESKIKLFENLYSKFENEFLDFLPQIYASLIMQIEVYRGAQRESFIEIIRPKALSFMGDPRLGLGHFGRWGAVGSEVAETFVKWISQYDLDAFFDVIGNSLTTAEAKNMWIYREKFWKSYKNHIQMVWVGFGSNAKVLAKSKNMSCGEYVGFGDGSKSCIMIVIGDYVFIERSHTGSLKVWKKKFCPFKIGASKIWESKVNKAKGFVHLENDISKDGWVHSSSDTYNWQKKVGIFIAQYMHISKPVSAWRV